MSEAQPIRSGTSDRRSERRPVAMRGMMIRDGRVSHVIEIVDLNYSGCGIRTPVQLEPGESVMVTVAGRGSIPAEVRWYDDGRAGLDFSPAAPERERVVRAPERIPVKADVIVRGRGRPSHRVEVRDLSTDGCQIEFAVRPHEGDALEIKFDYLEPLASEVLWVERSTAGLKFSHPIHPAVFSLLLERLAP